MARTFVFNDKGLESINGSPTHKGPGDVSVASGTSSFLAANPNVTSLEQILNPSPVMGPKV